MSETRKEIHRMLTEWSVGHGVYFPIVAEEALIDLVKERNTVPCPDCADVHGAYIMCDNCTFLHPNLWKTRATSKGGEYDGKAKEN